jgi:hypothetical protein
MNTYALSHLADQVLLRDLAALVARDRTTTAALLAHLAEVDERRLYLPAAHPSMFSYCVHVLHLSEQATYKRIRVARLARQFPAIFTAVAEGRVHLGGVILLAPHLTHDTVDGLLAAVTHKTCAEIEGVLAQRFPQPDLPTRVVALPPTRPVEGETTDQLSTWTVEPGAADQLSTWTVEAPVLRPRVAQLGAERFSLQLTMGQDTHKKLRYAQALLSHQLPSGDVAEVFDRALDALIVKLEQTKFAATDRPRPGRQHASANPRYVPAHVKRAVCARDGGRCTFMSEAGERCPAVKLLQFDHIDEVARGGQATTDRMRLRCRAHNQYEAERTFGKEFMQGKREEARRVATERGGAAERAAGQERVVATASAAADARASAERAAAQERAAAERAAAQQRAAELDIIPCLRQLGFRAEEARLAARHCETIPDAPIEERVRTALKFLGTRGRTYGVREAASSPGAAAGFVAP